MTLRYVRVLAVASSFIAGIVLSACAGNTNSAVVPQASAGLRSALVESPSSRPVHLSEITVPQADSAPVIVGVSNNGTVYFGSFDGDAGYSLPTSYCMPLPQQHCPGAGYSLDAYAGGSFSQVAPHGPDGGLCSGFNCCPGNPQVGCDLGGVSAIDAADFSSPFWASLYAFWFATQPGFPWGELEDGATPPRAATPPAQYNVDFGTNPGSSGAYAAVITSIARGSNGAVWIGGGGPSGAIGNPAKLPAAYLGSYNNSDYLLLASGPKHDVWGVTHATSSTSAIFEFGVSGATLHTYTVPSYIAGIAGSIQDLWFTDNGRNKIGRMNASGHIVEYAIPTPNSGAYQITVAADGTAWFTEANASKVGRITRNGRITEFSLPTQGAVPAGISATPPGCVTPAIWVGEVEPVQKLVQITY